MLLGIRHRASATTNISFLLRVSSRNAASSSSRVKSGVSTPQPPPKDRENNPPPAKSPFYFDTGYALFAKRAPRPFPSPFHSPPSGPSSDPFTALDSNRDRRVLVGSELIRGLTNGDDSVLAQSQFIGVNDGVGQWATKPKGHAGLWSRLILHFWDLEIEKYAASSVDSEPDIVGFLQISYEKTIKATAEPNETLGTTTACGAFLHHSGSGNDPTPLLFVANVGDSQIMVIRPDNQEVIFKTTEQWHWFDCPRQLGTNSPDTPNKNAVLSKIALEEGDIVLAMSDGLIDNLWEHEIVQNVVDSRAKWNEGARGGGTAKEEMAPMQFVAQELVKAAKVIAEDPFAESVFMERAVEEGLAMEGGKLDDISVVAAICKRREG